MTALPERLGLQVIEGPARVGSELRWRVLDRGEPAVLGQLLPELAHDPSLRRRYVRDVERLQALSDTALARVRRLGPSPDPRDPTADPPWRLRDDPPGQTLEAWLERRAPAPVDEAVEVIAALAERIHQIHAHGAVLRDLDPRLVVLGDDGAVWLTDVGLARVDVLSTRTAASLLLEGSPYAAPELLAHTVVDQRADVYGLGVLLFRALGGELPGGDEAPLLRPSGPAPRVVDLRPEVPPALDALVARCLAQDPSERPGSATELAQALRGHAPLPELGARVACQACGKDLRLGQRLCTHCGKLAVQFRAAPDDDDSYDLVLRKIDERAASRQRLRQVLGAVSEGPLPPLNFLVGDQRMYSKAERKRLVKLPATLVRGLDHDGAQRLADRLQGDGLETRVIRAGRDAPLSRNARIGLTMASGMSVAIALGLWMVVGGSVGAVVALTALAVSLGFVYVASQTLRSRQRASTESLVRLRSAPAALPASDPLVARLAALLQHDPPADLREQIGALALAVQRLVDHRATHRGAAAEIDVVTAPVAELVRLCEAQVHAIGQIDAELRTLDEGALVRALAAAEARGDPPAAREQPLHGLDRLRALEDARARRFHRLLEATRLARRAVELGLAVHDGEAEHQRQIDAALATLRRELPESDEPAMSPAPAHPSPAPESDGPPALAPSATDPA